MWVGDQRQSKTDKALTVNHRSSVITLLTELPGECNGKLLCTKQCNITLLHVCYAFFHLISSGACFSRVQPLPLKNPQLVAHSQSALSLLGLPASQATRPELVDYFSGNKLLPGSEPAAHCYCGHQFGHFSGQLGDGCAM